MLFAGIDWSERFLDFHLRTAEGTVLAEGQVKPSVEGMADLFAKLEPHARPDQIGIAIETAQGAWVQALLDRGYQVYPVNPKTVERFRQALSANGVKTDKIDRKVLAMFLVTFHQENKPLRPDDPEIVALRIACQDRLHLVEECTAKLQELRAHLKCHYPAVLGLFGALDSKITLKFLEQFPTQNQMLALTERRFINWLKRHHYTCPQRLDEMLELLKQPVLSVPEHLQKAKEPRIRFLARSIRMLKSEIAERDEQMIQDPGLTENQAENYIGLLEDAQAVYYDLFVLMNDIYALSHPSTVEVAPDPDPVEIVRDDTPPPDPTFRKVTMKGPWQLTVGDLAQDYTLTIVGGKKVANADDVVISGPVSASTIQLTAHGARVAFSLTPRAVGSVSISVGIDGETKYAPEITIVAAVVEEVASSRRWQGRCVDANVPPTFVEDCENKCEDIENETQMRRCVAGQRKRVPEPEPE